MIRFQPSYPLKRVSLPTLKSKGHECAGNSQGEEQECKHQRGADDRGRLGERTGGGNRDRPLANRRGRSDTHDVTRRIGGEKKAPDQPGPQCSKSTDAYFSEVLIELNLVFRLLPRPLTTAIMASEMPAAMRPYSMAVAPDWSFTKRAIRFFIDNSM